MSPTSAPKIIHEVTSWNNNQVPDSVWCCAGVAKPTIFLDTPTSILHEQMDNNYFSGAYMAHAILSAWIKGDSSSTGVPSDPTRHLIFTSSFAALFPMAGYAPYSPTKAALRSLHDTLSMELQLYSHIAAPVKVHTIFPATILSEGYTQENTLKSDLTKKLEEADAGRTPEVIAARSLKALERGEELITTDILTRLVSAAVISGSRRTGWGIIDAVLASFMHFVMLIVRWDGDRTTKYFAKVHGSSGFKTVKE